MSQNQNIQFIDKHFKSQITNYLKNINEFNMEIDLGSISDSAYVFNTKIDKSIYDLILNRFLNEKKYRYKKNLSHLIYYSGDLRLYIDKNQLHGIPKCIKTNYLSSNFVKINKHCCDLKVRFIKTIPTNSAEFPCSDYYDCIVERNTISLNYDNMFYLNFSELSNEIETYYEIKILMSKSIKTKKINVVKSLTNTIKKIISLQGIELNKIDLTLSSQDIY